MKTFEIIKKVYKHHSPNQTILAIHEIESSLREDILHTGGKILTFIPLLISIAFKLVIFAVLPVALFILISAKTASLGDFHSSTVFSGGMAPKVPAGSMIFTIKDWPYRQGDIVSYKNENGETITKRITNRLSRSGGIYYQTKGDADSDPDNQLVSETNIFGKAVFTVPFMGYFAAFLQTTPGFLGFIVAPVVLLISLELISVKNELEKGIQKKILTKLSVG